MPDTENPEVLTVDELSALLRIGRRQCYELVREGRIPGVIRLGRRSIRISRAAIDVWLLDGAGEAGTEEAQLTGGAPTDQVGDVVPWKKPSNS